jgi:hypothetical protein
MAPADRRRLPAAAASLLVALAAAVVGLAGPAAAAAAGSGRLEPKGAKITLQAKWQGTPLLHEAAEFLVSALWPAAVAGASLCHLALLPPAAADCQAVLLLACCPCCPAALLLQHSTPHHTTPASLPTQAEEDPALFWRFVEDWQQQHAATAGSSSPSREQCWTEIQTAGSAHLSPNMAKLLGVSLAARQYSARLEMFRQLAHESRAASADAAASGSGGTPGCCWALLGGRAYMSAAELESALAAVLQGQQAGQQAAEEGGVAGAVYPFDHIYRSSEVAAAPQLNISGSGTVPAVLYAPMGSPCAAELHVVLAVAAARSDAAAAAAAPGVVPRLAYAWRPLLDAAACSSASSSGAVQDCTTLGTEERLVLPGYGVELALKNMEYNAQDDSKKVRPTCALPARLPARLPAYPLACLVVLALAMCQVFKAGLVVLSRDPSAAPHVAMRPLLCYCRPARQLAMAPRRAERWRKRRQLWQRGRRALTAAMAAWSRCGFAWYHQLPETAAAAAAADLLRCLYLRNQMACPAAALCRAMP